MLKAKKPKAAKTQKKSNPSNHVSKKRERHENLMLSALFSFLRNTNKLKEKPVLLLVGLGNPGEKYTNNRHNIGFMAIEEIADVYGSANFQSKFNGLYAQIIIDGQKVGLLKPMTYMNESGQSVGAAAKFFKIPPEDIYVFHDELDLDAGKVRMKSGGGHAGHNGLRSIDAHLGTREYNRIRQGIGHPGSKEKVHGYVLSDFSKPEQKWLEDELYALAKHAPLLVKRRESDYMSKVALEIKT